MFDFNTVDNRFFETKIGDKVYKVEPCSVKTLKKLKKVDGNSEGALEEITQLVVEIISKNVDGLSISTTLFDDLSFDALFGFIVCYMEWLSKVRNSPNL